MVLPGAVLLCCMGVRAEVYTVPWLVPAGTSDAPEGVLRLLNGTDVSGTVQIHAVDDDGNRSGPASATLNASAAVEFTATELASGSAEKGLSGSIGAIPGDARLVIHTELSIVPLALVRAPDGTLSAMHDTVRASAASNGGYEYEVPIFNPSTETTRVSRLRLINPDDQAASVTIQGRDDTGAAATGGTVELTLAAGAATILTAQQLETGDTSLTGRLGAGVGKWRLTVSSDRRIQVVSAVSAASGYTNNLSTTAVAGLAPADHAAFNERFLDTRLRFRTAGGDFTFTAEAGDRFTRIEESDGTAVSNPGSYAYEAIGAEAGRLTESHDAGGECTANLYFATRTGGWFASRCTGADDAEGTWRGGGWSVGDDAGDGQETAASGYGVDDALPGVPSTGAFAPAAVYGATVSTTADGAAIELIEGGYFELDDGTRYTCTSSGGCGVRNGTITRGVLSRSATGAGTVDTFPTFRTATAPGDQVYMVGTAIDTLTLPAASGGDGTLTYTLSPNVPGLSFNATARQLAGTPSTAGTYWMTYTLTDGDADSDVLTFLVTVDSMVAVDRSIVEYLTGPVTEGASPGLIAAIIDTQGIRALASLGVRKAGTDEPFLDTDTVHLASNTKAMTSTMLATMIADGLFANGWETTIGDVFPELLGTIHADYHAVTLWQLVTMRGGIQPNANRWSAHQDLNIVPRRYEILRENLQGPSATPDGEYEYSNLSYMVAGAMAEKISGKSWETLMRERIFQPLDMSSAGFGPPGTPEQVDQPWGHQRDPDTSEWVPSQRDNYPALGPAGTVHVSVQDWAKFIALWFTDTQPAILSRTELNRLTTPTVGDYAAGWVVPSPLASIWHNGTNNRWYTELRIDRSRGVAFLAAANSRDRGVTDDLVRQILSSLRDHSPPTFRTATAPRDQVYTVGTTIATLRLPAASGGDGTLTYTLSPNVPGLSFNATARQLTGAPTAAGTYAMTYTVSDADGDSDTLGFTIMVSVCHATMMVRSGQSCIYPGTADAFSVDTRGRGSFLTFLDDIRIRIDNQTIDGLTYDLVASHQGDGVWRIDRIAGSTEPPTPGFAAGSAPGDRTYPVGAAIDTLTLPAARGGDGTLTYTLSPNVPGLSFDATARQLTGTPSTTGTYLMTYTVTDGDGDSDALNFLVTVDSMVAVDRSIVEYLIEPVAEGASPGLIAAIIDTQGIRALASAGVRKAGTDEPFLDTDTVHLASNTKAMTSTMLATMIADGLFANGWETTIGDVFPELLGTIHAEYHAVTLWQLVTMRGGIQPNATRWRVYLDLDIVPRRYEILRDNLQGPSAIPAGEYEYSNLSYMVAGAMAEKISGKSWETLMRERIFQPLGMTSAGFGPPGTPGQVDQPWGHRRDPDTSEWVPSQRDNAAALGPAGTVHVSIQDYAKFIALWFSDTQPAILSRTELNRLMTPTVGNYAAGWAFADRAIAIYHSGSNTYWRTWLWIDPARGEAYLAAGNARRSDMHETDDLVWQIMGNLMRHRPTEQGIGG